MKMVSPPSTLLQTPSLSCPSSSSQGRETETCCTSLPWTIHLGRWTFFGQVLLLSTLLLATFFGYTATHVAQRIAHNYIKPLILAQIFTPNKRESELTYFYRNCSSAQHDLSTSNVQDLIFVKKTKDTQQDDTTAGVESTTLLQEELEAAVAHSRKHGVTVFPELLSPHTAHTVREFILEENLKSKDPIGVQSNKNRWSFGIQVDQHPSLALALKEILGNALLVGVLERLMGPDPAVIEFSAITSAYGAKNQSWHTDVNPDLGVMFGRSYIPSYSLFIPLQNTTAAMGATQVCPGSHKCASGGIYYCDDHGFPVSGSGPQDFWPAGSGALISQQTCHMGSAHRDKDGLHRVLFYITFAARPHYNEHDNDHVETRMVSQGGTYSLHWSQWGHTLRDFRDAATHMQQPWRTLRSFALYKPRDRNWGYDFITQASTRIATNGFMFQSDDLEEYVNKKGGFELVPKWLQAKIPDYDEKSSYEVWIPYYLETLQNCQDFLQRVYVSLALSLSALLLFGRVMKRREYKGYRVGGATGSYRIGIMCSSLLALLVLHVMILVLAWKYLDAVATSWWGKTIRSGRAYRWPELPHSVPHHLNHHHYLQVDHSDRKSGDKGTLPTVNDVMVFDDLQSDYLGYLSSMLEATHNGNAAWIEAATSRAYGYSQLPGSLQRQLCTSLLKWNRQLGRRVLIKNAYSQWSEASTLIATRWCHKDLMIRDVHSTATETTSHMIRQLDILLSRAKFGYWCNTAMMRHGWIPGLLVRLQDEILRYQPHSIMRKDWAVSSSLLISANEFDRSSFVHRTPSILYKFSIVQHPNAASDVALLHHRHSPLLSNEEVNHTEEWLQVGDDVQAVVYDYDVGDYSEWSRATITSVDASTMTWTALYRHDGNHFSLLCEHCVRRIDPSQLQDDDDGSHSSPLQDEEDYEEDFEVEQEEDEEMDIA